MGITSSWRNQYGGVECVQHGQKKNLEMNVCDDDDDYDDDGGDDDIDEEEEEEE